MWMILLSYGKWQENSSGISHLSQLSLIIPFLDVLVRRNEDDTLGHKVYRQPTHTDRYLNATSSHHPSQKNSVINSLTYLQSNLTISELAFLDGELEYVNQVLTKNGYNNKDTSRTTQKLKNKSLGLNTTKKPEKEKEKKKMAVLPHVQGAIERIHFK